MQPYDRQFYERNAREVARDLLGDILVHVVNGTQVTGRIVETEAYTGTNDLASHGRAGKTPRNLPMWEAPGHAYVYLTYGIHKLLNIVCEPAEQPAAVLIRAVEPLDGLEIIAQNRPDVPQKHWSSGPGRLTQAMGIGMDMNRTDMTTTAGYLWIIPDQTIPDERVKTGPRIGLGKNVGEPWFSMPWRWWVADNPYVSRKK
jgi:DNA-3-methyladenine glycosylase